MKNQINYLYRGTSIKTKWIIFVIILVLYPIILIGYVGYANYEQVITKHFIETVQKDIYIVSEQFQEEIQDIENFLDGIQQDEAVHQFTNIYYNLLKNNDIDKNKIDEEEGGREKYNKVIKGNFDLKQKVSGYLKSLILTRVDVTLAAYQFAEGKDDGYIEVRSKSSEFENRNSFMYNNIFENINKGLGSNRVGYYVDDENNIYIGKKIFIVIQESIVELQFLS